MKKYLFGLAMLLIVCNVLADFYYVKVNALNVRMKSNTDSKVVKILKKGDRINVTEKENKWGKINNNEWVYMPLLSSQFVSKSTKTISKNRMSEISNYDIKSAIRNFSYPLTCSNWSISEPRDAVGEPNYAVQVFCDCEHPDVADYVLKAQFLVLISKKTLKPVKVIDVME
jgi:hypothetical protein